MTYEIVSQNYTVTSAAATDAVTIADVKRYLRLDTSDENPQMLALIPAATNFLQNLLSRQFVTATYAQYFNAVPSNPAELFLAVAPVSSITSVAYVDDDGDTQTWSSSSYQTDLVSEPAKIKPAWGESWPTIRQQYAAITVTYVAGYGAQSAVPKDIKQTIALLVSHWYENREPVGKGSELPFSLQSMINSLRWNPVIS